MFRLNPAKIYLQIITHNQVKYHNTLKSQANLRSKTIENLEVLDRCFIQVWNSSSVHRNTVSEIRRTNLDLERERLTSKLLSGRPNMFMLTSVKLEYCEITIYRTTG